MSLTEYRRKRQFGTTREPEPGKRLPKGKRAIFVVQLHHGSRRHYDFQLQVGDVLKSWAVPKGPSYDPGIKRMAVAHGFADAMAQAEPLKFVATATKQFRIGKVLIDYLRNGRDVASVASFSLRAREGAPVTMPLHWDEFGRVKDGDAFDIDSAPRRMKRLKHLPWQGIDAIRQDIDKSESCWTPCNNPRHD